VLKSAPFFGLLKKEDTIFCLSANILEKPESGELVLQLKATLKLTRQVRMFCD
jgi:hypothetical protein